MNIIDPDEKKGIIDPDEKKSYSWSRVPGKALTNIPRSAIEFGKGMVSAVTSPVQTAKSIGKTALGAAELLIPGEQGSEEYAEALGSFYKQRYGGIENLKKTIAEDPTGFVADLSTFVTGLGSASRVGTLSKIGRIAEPVNIAKQVVTAPLKLIPEAVEKRFYASALKGLTGKKISWGNKQEIIKAGVKEGAFVTERGLAKLGDKIDNLTNKFDETVLANKQQGKLIPAKDIVKYLDDVEDSFAAMPDPTGDLETISKIKENFLKSHGIAIGGKSVMINVPKTVNTGLLDSSGKPIFKTIQTTKVRNIPGKMEIPVEEAMTIKRAAYNKYQEAYKKHASAEAEANKALARGIKEEFINLNPELRVIGKEEKVMIDLQEAVEASLKRSQNYDVVRFPSLIAGGAAGAVTESPKMAVIAYTAKALMDSPAVKSAIAIALDRAKQLGKVSPRITTVRQVGFQVGRMKQITPQLEE